MKRVIIDKDATWKIIGEPMSVVRSYMNGLPDDAMLCIGDNDEIQAYRLVPDVDPKMGFTQERKVKTGLARWTEVKWGRPMAPEQSPHGVGKDFYGYFEQWDDEDDDFHTEGGLWYSVRDDGTFYLDDYDGVYALPATVKGILVGAGFTVEEEA